MSSHPLLVGSWVALATVVGLAQPAVGPDLAPFESKLAGIVERGRDGGAPTGATTVLEEPEINAYLDGPAAAHFPPGVSGARLTLGAGGRVTGQATVDLAVVSGSARRSVFDPLAYLSGIVPVEARVELTADRGQGQIAVESTTVGGVPVPASVLRELVRRTTRSATLPDGFDIEAPFDLPYGVTAVTVEERRAVIVQ